MKWSIYTFCAFLRSLTLAVCRCLILISTPSIPTVKILLFVNISWLIITTRSQFTRFKVSFLLKKLNRFDGIGYINTWQVNIIVLNIIRENWKKEILKYFIVLIKRYTYILNQHSNNRVVSFRYTVYWKPMLQPTTRLFEC